MRILTSFKNTLLGRKGEADDESKEEEEEEEEENKLEVVDFFFKFNVDMMSAARLASRIVSQVHIDSALHLPK